MFVRVIRRDNSMVSMDSPLTNSPPSNYRRFAAIVYDTVALAAIWFFATLIVIVILQGQAIAPGNPFFMLYLLIAAYAYFGWCWTRGGQTLGMKAWNITLVAADAGQPIGWSHATLRFGAAIISWSAFGLGFLAIAYDRDRRSWHDRISRSYLRHR